MGPDIGGKVDSFDRGIHAASDDQWEPVPDSVGDGSPAVTVADDVKLPSDTEIHDLKKALVSSFYRTEFGLKVTCETKAEIVELITRLDALNPTPAPTDSLALLNGKWILAFLPVVIRWITSFGEGGRNISDHRLGQLRRAELSSILRSINHCYVPLSAPMPSLKSEAPNEFRSSWRRGRHRHAAADRLRGATFGQKINLASFKGIVSSLHGTASSAVRSISSALHLT